LDFRPLWWNRTSTTTILNFTLIHSRLPGTRPGTRTISNRVAQPLRRVQPSPRAPRVPSRPSWTSVFCHNRRLLVTYLFSLFLFLSTCFTFFFLSPFSSPRFFRLLSPSLLRSIATSASLLYHARLGRIAPPTKSRQACLFPFLHSPSLVRPTLPAPHPSTPA